PAHRGDADFLAKGLQVVRGHQGIVAIALAICCFGGAVGLQMVRDRLYPRDQSLERALMYVRSGPAMRRIALSFDALLADVYWIRAVQHYGGDRLDRSERQKYELLYPLLDITTSLDPLFSIAYRFGSIFLSEGYPGGPGRPDQAIALLRKGIAAQPTKWEYYHDIAFVYYWQLRDMPAAAEWFRKAAAQPGAPNWLEPMAAAMLVEGGDRASARFLLQQILKSDQVWLQRMAARGLMQVDALDGIDLLRQRVAAYPPPAGQPYSWEWLLRRGVLRGIPTDPTGVPFEIDPASGAISVSSRSELHPMPGSPK
ncbi:MAG: tetratricopeptide repeat protein, partial [Vicinamibacterales bacterium]